MRARGDVRATAILPPDIMPAPPGHLDCPPEGPLGPAMRPPPASRGARCSGTGESHVVSAGLALVSLPMRTSARGLGLGRWSGMAEEEGWWEEAAEGTSGGPTGDSGASRLLPKRAPLCFLACILRSFANARSTFSGWLFTLRVRRGPRRCESLGADEPPAPPLAPPVALVLANAPPTSLRLLLPPSASRSGGGESGSAEARAKSLPALGIGLADRLPDGCG